MVNIKSLKPADSNPMRVNILDQKGLVKVDSVEAATDDLVGAILSGHAPVDHEAVKKK